MGFFERFFQKKINVNQIANLLLALGMETELFEKIVLEIKKRKNSDTNIISDEDKIYFSVMTNVLFAIDYSVYCVFPEKDLSDAIRDEVNKLVREGFPDEYVFFSREINNITIAVKEETDEPFLNAGYYFSTQITTPSIKDLGIASYSSKVFIIIIERFKNTLNDIRNKNKIIY